MMMVGDDDQDVASAGGHVDSNDERNFTLAIAIMLLTMRVKAAMSMLMVCMSTSMIMSCQSVDLAYLPFPLVGATSLSTSFLPASKHGCGVRAHCLAKAYAGSVQQPGNSGDPSAFCTHRSSVV